MSGYGFGRGYGMAPAGGPASSEPTPGELTGMVVWISAKTEGSFETAEANHTPGTPYHMLSTQVITNLASGGPTLSFNSASAVARPYYHTADWTLNVGVDETLPRPNGHPFVATNKPSDNTLTTCTDERINFSAKTVDSAEYSGVSVMYFESTGIGRRIWENIGGGGAYGQVEASEDSFFRIFNSVTNGSVDTGAQSETRGFWVVITWRQSATGGAEMAWNGVRGAGNVGLVDAMSLNCFRPYSGYTTAWTEQILYAGTANSMAQLDVVGQQFATKYGITYTAP